MKGPFYYQMHAYFLTVDGRIILLKDEYVLVCDITLCHDKKNISTFYQ